MNRLEFHQKAIAISKMIIEMEKRIKFAETALNDAKTKLNVLGLCHGLVQFYTDLVDIRKKSINRLENYYNDFIIKNQ